MSDEAPHFTAFISYASADLAKAEEVCARLESQGHTCWIAPRNIRAGQEYADAIVHGIEHSGCLVLLLSESANQSAFVHREVERAVSKGKPIFPFRVQEVLPCSALELFVSSSHWIDAWHGKLTDHIDQLANDLEDRKGAAPTASTVIAKSASGGISRWIWAAGIVVVIGALSAVGVAMKGSRVSVTQ
jgi:hypothetical protein